MGVFAKDSSSAKLRFLYLLLRTGGVRSLWYRIKLKWRRIRLGGDSTQSPVSGSQRPQRPSPLAAAPRRRATSLEKPGDIVVYTAIFGRYDRLLPALFPDVRHVCFADDREVNAAGWEVHYAPCTHPAFTARQYKIAADKWFSESRYSIWVDGNLQLAVHPRILVADYLANVDLATFIHPERRCTYQEADFVIHLGLDDPSVVKHQMERYRREGFPRRRGLLETALILRRHTPQIQKLHRLWWREIAEGSQRDQLSIMYALWKTQCAVKVIAGGREFSPLVRFQPHLQVSRISAA